MDEIDTDAAAAAASAACTDSTNAESEILPHKNTSPIGRAGSGQVKGRSGAFGQPGRPPPWRRRPHKLNFFTFFK